MLEWLRTVAAAHYLIIVPTRIRLTCRPSISLSLWMRIHRVFSAGLIEATVPDILMVTGFRLPSAPARAFRTAITLPKPSMD